MSAEIEIMAARQRGFEKLCINIEQQLAEGVQGEKVGEELKRQLEAGAHKLVNSMEEAMRLTRKKTVRKTLATACEAIQESQCTLALKITKAYEGVGIGRAEEPLMNSTMREVIAATGYMREPKVAKFDGSVELWPTFKDLFISEVHQRYPDDVTKLVYLQQLCVGEAKRALGQWKPTSANYKLAWDTLCTRYNDERAIKQAAAHIITTLAPVRSETREGLRSLIDATNNALRQLEAAGCPTAQWDELVISKWMECLPLATYRKWKRHLQGRSDITYRELCEFVETEARTCEDIERRETKLNSQDDSRQERSDKYHEKRRDGQRNDRYSGRHRNRRDDRYRYRRDDRQSYHRNSPPADRPKENKFERRDGGKFGQYQRGKAAPFVNRSKCGICGGSHPPWDCDQFRRMSLQMRREEVVKRHLCNRCLKDHRGIECLSKFLCHKCKGPHSSLLCNKRPNEQEGGAQ